MRNLEIQIEVLKKQIEILKADGANNMVTNFTIQLKKLEKRLLKEKGV